MDELLDYVDENDCVIGQVYRSEIDRLGLIGRIAAVVVLNTQGEIMLCKEAAHKSGAGKWKFSAAGHIPAGYLPEVAAIKEAEEEIGICIKPENLEKLFVINRIEEAKPRRIQHIFKTIHNGPFVLDNSEWEEYRFVSVKEIDDMLTNNPDCFSGTYIEFWKMYKNYD